MLVLVLAAFLLLTAWAFMQPLGAGPDEKMRYMVAQYLHKHPGKLPLGDDPLQIFVQTRCKTDRHILSEGGLLGLFIYA